MKVATLEKFHLRGRDQDPGDPGVGKVRGERFFSLQAGGGTDRGWHYVLTLKNWFVTSILPQSLLYQLQGDREIGGLMGSWGKNTSQILMFLNNNHFHFITS